MEIRKAGRPCHAVAMPDSDLSQVPHGDRIAFLTELAERLHAYGTTAQRLEGALLGVADRLDVECEPWVNPTGMILTFRDPANLQAPDLTRVIRMPPGDTDLSRLSRADRIAEDVVAGRMGVAEGRDALERIELPRTVRWRVMQVAAFRDGGAAVGLLAALPWLDIAPHRSPASGSECSTSCPKAGCACASRSKRWRGCSPRRWRYAWRASSGR
jgi:Uncharacterized conserved protein